MDALDDFLGDPEYLIGDDVVRMIEDEGPSHGDRLVHEVVLDDVAQAFKIDRQIPGAQIAQSFGDGHIATVTGYFDPGAVPRQVGLDIVVQPPRIGPFSFGTAAMVHSGKRVEPTAFSVTFLGLRPAVADEESGR